MACNKCKTRKCSCEDQGLHAPCPPCTQGTYECPNPDLCPETFSTDCIIYTGDSLPIIGIEHGDSLSDIIQKFGLHQLLSCFPITVIKNTVGNLHSTAVTDTSISVKWVIFGTTSVSFTPQYSIDQGSNWISGTLVGATSTQATLTGLTADTEYWVRIKTLNSSNDDCYSMIILVKTNTTI